MLQVLLQIKEGNHIIRHSRMCGSWLKLVLPLQGRIGTSLAWPNLMAKFGFVPGRDNIFEKSLSMTSCRRDFVSSYVGGFTWKEFVTLSSYSVKISQYLHLSPLAALHPSLILSFDLHCGASSPPLWPPGSTWWEVARRRQAARPALAHSFAGLRGCVRGGLDTMRGCVMNVGDRCRRWTSPICSRFIHRYTRTTVDSTNSPQESLSLLVPQIQICFIF